MNSFFKNKYLWKIPAYGNGNDCDIINFEINIIFLIKLFFLHEQKFKAKI